jgi:cAMP-dependent protein kinase regulator
MSASFDPNAKEILVQLVTSLLVDKPRDPVPYIYSYLVDLSKNQEPNPLTENEVNELRNLKKKVEYLRDQLEERGDADSQKSEDEDQDDEAEIDESKKAKAKNKGQRGGVSAEVYGTWNKKEDFKPRIIEKTHDQMDKLKKRLLESFLFNSLDEGEFNVVVGAIEEKRYQPGDYVIKEGDQGDEMFLVESGNLDCTKVFKGNTEPTHLKVYEPGEGFGELALLYNAPRAASIKAKSECVCWALDRPTFNNIVKDAAAKKREKYDDFLNSVQIL